LGSDRGRRWNLRNLFAVDHRKALIIDGRIGWVGTAGIEDRFEDGRHHDLFVRVEGPVVHQLQAVFLASYRWLGGVYSACDVPRLFPAISTDVSGVPAVVLHNAPGPYRPISEAIVELLSSAQHRLDIMNPYVAHHGMFRLLVEAARRGVKVRLVVPPRERTWLTGYARLYHQEELSDAGVEVWTYPAVAHAKAFVRDDAEVLVGSCNLESWSLYRFFELDIRIQSPDLAHQFRTKLFDPDIAISTPAQPADGIKDQILSHAIYLVSPLL
jgi:cardiolipin synthase